MKLAILLPLALTLLLPSACSVAHDLDRGDYAAAATHAGLAAFTLGASEALLEHEQEAIDRFCVQVPSSWRCRTNR